MSAYWVPKGGTAQSEWEDGAAYSAASGWFAVTDGASTGSNSREWAYSLANRFVADRPAAVFDGSSSAFVDWLENTRARFDPQSPEFPVSRMPAWVQEAGARSGAYATLLGGRVHDGQIRAVAVGDCCLFHLNRTGRPAAFPLLDPHEFGTSPQLISSRQSDRAESPVPVAHFRAPVSPGDVLFGASDAVAEWLIGKIDQPAVWETMSRISNQGFNRLCGDLREARQMKNDDVTLFRAIVPSDKGMVP